MPLPFATILRRPWPPRTRSSTSTLARRPTPARPAACAAPARSPASSTAATRSPVAFAVAERTLRHALAASGAVLELSIDGATATPAVLKDAQRHPVRGDLMHVDLLRVDLNVAIQATVTVELLGDDEAPGVIEGGILEHVTREVNVEALPNEIPETIQVDVSKMEMNGTFPLGDVDGARAASRSSTTPRRRSSPRSRRQRVDGVRATRSRPRPSVVGEGGGAAEAAEAGAGEAGDAEWHGDSDGE